LRRRRADSVGRSPTASGKTVTIDCFPERAKHYRHADAIVAVDVIRATTTVVTAAVLGRSCFVVPTIDEAFALADRLRDPLLVGEVSGEMPDGFHLHNSPAAIATRTDIQRPMILVSTSGTRLIVEAEAAEAVYVACLRNLTAQASYVAAHHSAVVLLGAGSRGEFRDEDQLCCAWIAQELVRAGYTPTDDTTRAVIERWDGVPVDAVERGASAAYLRRTGQHHDLEFITAHVNDLTAVYRSSRGRIERAGAPRHDEPGRGTAVADV